MSLPVPTPRASAASRRGSRASMPTCGVCGERFPEPPRVASLKTVSCGVGCTMTIHRAALGTWTTRTLLADGTSGAAT